MFHLRADFLQAQGDTEAEGSEESEVRQEEGWVAMTTTLTHEKYGGRPVVRVDGYLYYIVSKHKTQFNARRQHRKLDFRGKIRKVGNWWMILQGLPKDFQEKRRMM